MTEVVDNFYYFAMKSHYSIKSSAPRNGKCWDVNLEALAVNKKTKERIFQYFCLYVHTHTLG